MIKKKGFKRAFKVVLAVAVIVAAISTINHCAHPYSTQTVVYCEYEKKIDGEGYILRNETIVSNDTPGVFEPFVNDGERVGKDAKIGTIISGTPDDNTVEELNSVNERIEDIEASASVAKLYSSDTVRISNAVNTDVKNLRTAVRDGDLSKAAQLKKEIGYLKNRTSVVESSESSEELLASLYERKAEIEAAIGGVQREIISPIAGVYSSAIDGLEKYGSETALAELTPSEVNDFDKVMEDYTRADNEICKITDNFDWYLVAVIDEADAKNISTESEKDQNKVTIKINDADEVEGRAYLLSEAEDGKRVAVFCSNVFVEGISSVRNVDYSVVLQREEGLKIPSDALKIENGKKGVYILIDKKKSFRYVNEDFFRSEDDTYYIVERKYTPSGAAADYVPLKEYDEVLLKPEDVK